MAKVLNGKIANQAQTEQVLRYPLRNYYIPKLSDIYEFVRNQNYELYNLDRIVFLQSYARMLKSRVLYQRYVYLYLCHSILYLQRFYLTLWRFKAKRVRKRNYERKQKIYAGICYLYQRRQHLITIERYIVYRRVLRYFYQIKTRYNYFRRLLRYALSFSKNWQNKVMLLSLRILRSQVSYRTAVQLYFRQQSETADISFELLSSYVLTRVEYFAQYYAKLLEYYLAVILELSDQLDFLMLQTVFYHFRRAAAEKQERVGMRRTAMQQSNFIELLFFGWKDMACNRHYLLAKHMFIWRRYVNSTEDHITRVMHLRIKRRCLQKLIIFKNTQLLYTKIDYLAAKKLPSIRFLCAAFTDYCTGASFLADGQFVSNEHMLDSLPAEASEARDEQRKTKFLLLLSRYTSQRKVFCRLVLLCNVFQHYVYVLLAFKLLSVKVASIKQYRILQMNNKQLFVQQTYGMLSDDDLWVIYQLAVSAGNTAGYERLLQKYPSYLRKFAHLVLGLKLYQLNKAATLWLESGCIFCDVLLFLRVVHVAQQRVFIEAPRDRDKLIQARVQQYRAIMTYHPLQALSFVQQFAFWDRFAKFYFLPSFYRRASAIGPFYWVLQKGCTHIITDIEEKHGVAFKNNDIIPYSPYFFQQCNLCDATPDCLALADSFSFRAFEFCQQTSDCVVSYTELDFIDKLMRQFGVYEARKAWIVKNYISYCKKHDETSHNEMMKNAYELISVGDAELLEAYYECKLITQQQSYQYVEIYNHRKQTADQKSAQAYKYYEEQLKRLAEHLRIYIKYMHAEKQVLLKHKLAQRAAKKNIVSHAKKHFPKKKHMVVKKIKKSRKAYKLKQMLTRTIEQFIGEDTRKNYEHDAEQEDAVDFTEQYENCARERAAASFGEKGSWSYKNKGLCEQVSSNDGMKSTNNGPKFDFAAGATSAAHGSSASLQNGSKKPGFAIAADKNSISSSDNVTAACKQSAYKSTQGSKLRNGAEVAAMLSTTEARSFSKASRTIPKRLGRSPGVVATKEKYDMAPAGSAFGEEKGGLHDAVNTGRYAVSFATSNQAAGAYHIYPAPKVVRATIQHSGMQTAGALAYAADYCSYSEITCERNGWLSGSDGLLSPGSAMPCIYGGAESPQEGKCVSYAKGHVYKMLDCAGIDYLAGAVYGEEMLSLLASFVENTEGFLKGAGCTEYMKNLLSYMVFSELDTEQILDSTPWLAGADKAALGELFTGPARKQLLSLVYLNIALPSSRTGQCHGQNAPAWIRPSVKQSSFFYVKQEQLGFPILVKSFADVQSTINELSNVVFDLSNLKVRQQLKHAVQPIYVRLLKGKMARRCANFAGTAGYGALLPRLHFRSGALPLPSHGVRQAAQLRNDLTVRFLKADQASGISITEADLDELMAFECSEEGPSPRYGAKRGPGNRGP